jgi:hypothetical protein
MKKAPFIESLFTMLQAENEPWLGDVFVAPPAFERLRENQSSIVYGEPGSGKTAIRLELQRQKKSGIFAVLWTPEPILEDPGTGTLFAQQAMRQALRACVDGLVLNGDIPRRLGEPSSYVASALQWLLQNYLPFDPDFYILGEADKLTEDEARWYSKLLKQPSPPISTEKTNIRDQIRLLTTILRQAKYERLWLMIDGLERWNPRRASEQVEAMLDAILSTLVFFDSAEVTYKFFLPTSYKRILNKTTGVERHRAEEVYLTWPEESLRAILEKRISCALSSNNEVCIESLCDDVELLNWLKEFGGNSPREWLLFTAPLVIEYQKNNQRLSTAETSEYIHQHPAPLRLDRERREVWIGKKCISIGSPAEFRVLEYLAAYPGRIGSLEELYYYAQEELNGVPDKGELQWVPKEAWRGAMDTLIWRLRHKIEKNPEKPLYLVTHHGKGLELLHAEM